MQEGKGRETKGKRWEMEEVLMRATGRRRNGDIGKVEECKVRENIDTLI